MSPCGQFLGQLHFRQNTSSQQQLLAQINQLVTTVTFSRQLFLQSSQFFCTIYCFRILTFSQQLFFSGSSERNFNQENLLLENQVVSQCSQLFRKTTFSKDKLVPNRNIYRISSFQKQLLPQSINFSEKLLFQQRYFLKIGTFSERLFFQKSYFLEVAIFSEDQ